MLVKNIYGYIVLAVVDNFDETPYNVHRVILSDEQMEAIERVVLEDKISIDDTVLFNIERGENGH